MSVIVKGMEMPIMCSYCKLTYYGQSNNNYDCCYCLITDKEIDYIAKHPDCPLEDADDGWISVEKKLPKKGQVVLWCNDDGNSFTSAITYECKGNWAIGNRHRRSRVIAWRPLPKPIDRVKGFHKEDD